MWKQISTFYRRNQLAQRLFDLLPSAFTDRMKEFVHAERIRGNPDRIYLEKVILPCLRTQTYSKILFIGCAQYTRHFGKFFEKTGTEYWTTDIAESAAVWGEKERHVICDAKVLDCFFPTSSFDLVVCNGVFGCGINDAKGMNQTLQAIYRILCPGGVLLLGWNLRRIPDPRELENMQKLYVSSHSLELPDRKVFDDVPFEDGEWHVYDIVAARNDVPKRPTTPHLFHDGETNQKVFSTGSTTQS